MTVKSLHITTKLMMRKNPMIPVDNYFASFDISKYDYRTNGDNLKAVQAYYDFLFNNTEAYGIGKSKHMSFASGCRYLDDICRYQQSTRRDA